MNANSCLYSFFDGSDDTLHIDVDGTRFADTSLGGKLGCPFAIEYRVPVIKPCVEEFLRAYKQAGVEVDFVFADWEVTGRSNGTTRGRVRGGADAASEDLRDRRLLAYFSRRFADSRGFNVMHLATTLRPIFRGVWLATMASTRTTDSAIGTITSRRNQRPGVLSRLTYGRSIATGCTSSTVRDTRFAMPVVYTWYPTFDWYDFDDCDYRWFYNMLQVGSNAGRTRRATSDHSVRPLAHDRAARRTPIRR